MTNNRFKPYWELCEDIEIWTYRYESYRAQYKALVKMVNLDGPKHIKGVDYSQPRVSGGGGQIDLAEAIERLQRIESNLFLHSEAITKMEEEKEKMEKKLKDLVGLEYRVIYMRDIEGKKLKDIASELNYSYDYIKEISARNPTKNPPK
ncbi:hypothetical protein [Senegalia massiliensis]|uniref:Uncharacterized protein n=1 Tax=Senegalia massiliensis TaxID=1720316 RepID=A0A845QZ47_9CLOT|nr:hypothetical protein [Senegalia massiliensis]NBI08227.1 hypothetical protein [Senegalia massiliensis]